MTFCCFRTMLSPLTMLISQNCTWQSFKYIIYLIYVHHRSNISYISQECCSTLHCRLLLFLTHHGLQMPTLWQNGVNPFGLNNEQGQRWNTMVFPFLPMAVTILVFQCLFRIPSLNPNSIGVQQPEYSFPLLVTTIKNVNLPAQESEKDWNFKHCIILSHKNALFSWIQKSLVSIDWAG